MFCSKPITTQMPARLFDLCSFTGSHLHLRNKYKITTQQHLNSHFRTTTIIIIKCKCSQTDNGIKHSGIFNRRTINVESKMLSEGTVKTSTDYLSQLMRLKVSRRTSRSF